MLLIRFLLIMLLVSSLKQNVGIYSQMCVTWMDPQSDDNRWLFMLGDGKPHLCSKAVSGSRCERPP